jgi:hypothetical protein
MIEDLSLEERETHFNMTGDNHDLWEVYTDDPYWIRRLDKIAKAWKLEHGGGKHYKLDASQITVRAKPKELSVEEKERRAAIMRSVRAKNSVNSLDSDTLAIKDDLAHVERNGMKEKVVL